MRKAKFLICDICGDEMGTFGHKSNLPDNDNIVRTDFPFSHACKKCEEVFKKIKLPELIRNEIINWRAGMPDSYTGENE